jgi:N-acetylmuramoyl-L-alanine amidase
MPESDLEIYVVLQGDCIASIAYTHGLHPDTIWEHPANKALKDKRKSGYVLEPGDELTIPAIRRRDERRAVDKRHRFKRRGVPEKLKLQFLEDDEPRAGATYVLEIEGKKVAAGKLDAEGRLEHWIAPDARRGLVTLDDGDEEVELWLGYLNPADDDEGKRDRLFNLGFFDGLSAGRDVDDAVFAFQDLKRIDISEDSDSRTQDELEESHGS